MNTSLFLPDSNAPIADKYAAAWEFIRSKYSVNERAHAFCWLSYRAFEGSLSFYDWNKHVLPNYFTNAGPRWDASMNAVCGFIFVRNSDFQKAEHYLQLAIHSANSITSIKAATVLAYIKWITNQPFEEIGAMTISMWKSMVAQVDLLKCPSWVCDGGYDAAPLHAVLKLLSNEGVTSNSIISRWWADHLISDDKNKPWLQCCNQILRDGFVKKAKIKVVCVLKSGGEYHSDHVENLRQACAKHMPRHEFVCLSDIEVPNCKVIKMQKQWSGWWSKIELFEHFKSGTTVYLDLDTVLLGDCSNILRTCQGASFYSLRDFVFGEKHPDALQSSVMIWTGDFSFIAEQFVFEKHSKEHHGDQNFIQLCLKQKGVKVGFLQDLSKEVVSYKNHVLKNGLQKNHKMIVFHGKPRPWDQQVVAYKNKRTPLSLRRGLVVPINDECALGIILREVADAEYIAKFCQKKQTVVQAGGNIGIWPIKFSSLFNRVITFEPDSDNFMALSINTEAHKNIIAHNFALGSKEGACSMQKNDGNIGAHTLSSNSGDIPVATIDSLNLNECDLIQLDVEGFEHNAILGAENTIKKLRPIIALELKGLGKKFGFSDEDTINLLKTWGYTIGGRVKNDVVFHPEISSI